MKPAPAFALATIFALLCTTTYADEVIGVVKRVKGPVAIERGGVTTNAAPGAEVQRGDRVITGHEGFASIAMRRTAPLTVGPQNDLTLDRYAADERPVVKRPAPPILQGLASFFAVNRQR
jgi:hypothetical protein